MINGFKKIERKEKKGRKCSEEKTQDHDQIGKNKRRRKQGSRRRKRDEWMIN